MDRGLGFGVGVVAISVGILGAPPAQAEPSQLRVIRPYEPASLPPRVLKAEPGTSPPPGYHAEQHIRVGLTIAGAAASTVGILLIFEGMAIHDQSSRVQSGVTNVDYSPMFYVLGGLNLAVGIPLLAVGLLDRKDVYVRDQAALRFAPQVRPGYAGGAMSVAF